VELKLDGEPEAVERLRDHPLLRGGAARTERLSAVYFDTDDLSLRAAGVSLRIRRSGEGSVQTIKAARGSGLALDRSEWDHPVADGVLDLSAAAGTALEPLIADGRASTLKPRFTVEVDAHGRHGGARRLGDELASTAARWRARAAGPRARSRKSSWS
jgi:inorganic triphosphatase YgiF